MKNLNTQKAFTMAEAILVMSILGVIAAVMIATIKPAEYKQKGYNLLAEKVISELDVATTQIMVNGGSLGYLENFYSGYAFDNATYMKYLSTGTKGATCPAGYNGFKLKDGACVNISNSAQDGVCAPKDSAGTGYTPTTTQTVIGYINIDVNGDDAPNAKCKDRFNIPVTREGIVL